MAMAAAPNEADTPLLIDSNRMLTSSRAAQCLQAVARRRREYSQFSGGMQLEQLSESDPLDVTEALTALVRKKPLGFLRAKAPDHIDILLRGTLYV